MPFNPHEHDVATNDLNKSFINGQATITVVLDNAVYSIRAYPIFEGAARFDDFVFPLTALHFYDGGKKVLVLWDHLPSHHAVADYFEGEHPAWFEFEYFPTYAPELNPVEQCWNRMKNECLPNFVPTTEEELVSVVAMAAKRINDEQKITAQQRVSIRQDDQHKRAMDDGRPFLQVAGCIKIL